MIKIAILLSSPRVNGNTDILLEKAFNGQKLKGLNIKKIIANSLNIKPCQGCGRCHKKGICVIRDDMAFVYKVLNESDIVLVGTPIYFGSVPAQLKVIIDRMQPLWARKYLLNYKDGRKRIGGLICVSSSNGKRYFDCVRKLINIFCIIQDIKFSRYLYAEKLEHKGDANKHKNILKKASNLGKLLIRDLRHERNKKSS